MAADYDTLKSDLVTFFKRGAKNEFSSFAEGLAVFIKAVNDYGATAGDTYSNKLTDFTGAELLAALATLTDSAPTSLSALQLATGLNLSFNNKNLDVANVPPGGQTGITNIVDQPVLVSDTQQKWKDFLDEDFKAKFQVYVDLGVPTEVVDELFVQEVAGRWADILEIGVEKSGWTFTYTQNTPPSFPSTTKTGKLL